MVNTKRTIPLSLVVERGLLESHSSVREKDITYTRVMSAIKNENVDYEPTVTKFFNEYCSTDKISDYIEVLEALVERAGDDEMKQKFVSNISDVITNRIVPDTINLNKNTFDSIKESTNVILQKLYTEGTSKVDDILEATRVLNNHKRISRRFNLESVIKECTRGTEEDAANILCEFVDTYNTSLSKKLNIAIEESLYLYESCGIECDKKTLVSNILEYFIKDVKLVPDRTMNSIKRVLENNSFITKADASGVNYLYNDSTEFNSIISMLGNSFSSDIYSDDIQELTSSCENKTVTIDQIKTIVQSIYNKYVLTQCTSLPAAKLVLDFIISIPVGFDIPGLGTEQIAGVIKDTFGDCAEKIDNIDTLNRYHDIKLYTDPYTSDDGDSVEEAVINSALAIDQAYMDLNNQFDKSCVVLDDNPLAFQSYQNIIKESKDFADSEDVKDLINKYKASQVKDGGKFKAIINKIYTKSPASIIDETPHILGFIRNFAVLSTVTIPAIGIPVAIIAFITDKFIGMKLKREETDKIVKYFKSEKKAIEKKINKAKDGPKKKRLEEYLDALDKSIEKLTDYHDDLYTDEEVNARDFLDEASNISFCEKLTPSEYFATSHQTMKLSLTRAIQLIKTELIRVQPTMLNTTDLDPTYLECNLNDENSFITNFVTPDGLISIPIMKVSALDRDIEIAVLDICSYVNGFMDKLSHVSCFKIDNDVYIVFEFIAKLDLTYSDTKDTMNWEASLQASSVLIVSEAVNEMYSELYVETIVKELSENVFDIAHDDVESVTNTMINSKLDPTEFIEALKDVQHNSNDYVECDRISNCIDMLTDDNCYNNSCPTESALIQLESVRILRSIISEAKNIDKSKGKPTPVTNVKNNIKAAKDKVSGGVDKAKTSVDNGAGKVVGKLADGKLSLTSNLGLATEVMKKKVQSLGTKEKETAQSIDAATSGFKRGVESALTNDRREAVIKGSVIPSFSKTIKLGLGAGGLWMINPVVAVIACIGGLATSKALNAKERQMILDEIDIELKVVEREIDNCKDSEDTQKYKRLLSYKSKLERESQRIRYKVKVYSKDKTALIDHDM